MSKLADRVEWLEREIQAIVPAIRSAQASQGVHEFVIVHLLSHIAQLAEDRDVYLTEIMQGIEISLKMQADAARKEYGPDVEPSLKATLDYFDQFKRTMLSTVTLPQPGTKN